MLIRSLIVIVIAVFSVVLLAGQVPTPRTGNPGSGSVPVQRGKLRDIPFPGGVDMQFLIKELARDLDLNVLFDPESFRYPGRKTYLELKNVTPAAAIDYILSQEGLYFEEVGPRTILVSNNAQRQAIPQLGLAVLPLSEQLAQYFGVQKGLLINHVRADSPAASAELRAGDVIVEVDGLPVNGPLAVRRMITDKKGSDIILTLVRDKKSQTMSISPSKSVESVLKD
mgnify:CR=1 FL=1